jgi:hypothetical protein
MAQKRADGAENRSCEPPLATPASPPSLRLHFKRLTVFSATPPSPFKFIFKQLIVFSATLRVPPAPDHGPCEPGRCHAQCYACLVNAGGAPWTGEPKSVNQRLTRIVALKATTLEEPLTMSRLDYRTKVLARLRCTGRPPLSESTTIHGHTLMCQKMASV